MTTPTSQPMYQRKRSSNNNANTDNNNNNMYNRNGDIEGGVGGSISSSSSGQRYRASNGTLNGGRASTTSMNDANANILEQQNNERMNELANHVALLKGLTIEIGNEVREQNSLLDNMNDGFTNTRDLLQGSLRRIGTMLEQGGTKHMCYMVLFCVAIMMILWWLMSSSK